MKDTCASCHGLSVTKIIKTDNEKKPKWLTKFDYVTNFIEKNNNKKIKIYKQKKTDTTMILDVGKSRAGLYVLYWAATPASLRQILIRNAKAAYSNFKNHGIAKVDKHGHVKLCFNCPQAYNTTQAGKKHGETFYKHVHLCFSNKACDKWCETVYTKIVLCKHTLSQTMKKQKMGNAVLINALPCEYYQKAHIPNSFNLPYNKIAKISQKSLKWFREVVKINYPKLHKLVHKNKINIYELPIIVIMHMISVMPRKSSHSSYEKLFVNMSEFWWNERIFTRYEIPINWGVHIFFRVLFEYKHLLIDCFANILIINLY